MTPCRRCGGGGEVRHRDDRDLHANHPDLRFVTCPRCLGDGLDEETTPAAYRRYTPEPS